MAEEATDTPLGSTPPTNETPSSTGGVTDPNATISPIKNDVSGITGFNASVDDSGSFYNALIQANYDNTKTGYVEKSFKRVKSGFPSDSDSGVYNQYSGNGGELVDILLTYPWTIQKFNNQTYGQNEYELKNKLDVQNGLVYMVNGEADSTTYGDMFTYDKDGKYRDKDGNEITKNAVINQYVKTDAYKAVNVPFCYVTQWKQTLSSNIMNIINSISAGITAISDGLGTIADSSKLTEVSTAISKLKNSLFGKTQQGFNEAQQDNDTKSWAKWVSNTAAGLQQGIGILSQKVAPGNISNPAVGTTWLSPYKFLYSLERTGKKYCFPMVANPPSNSIQNNFGEQADGGGLLNNSFFNGLISMMQGASNTVRDFKDVVNFLSTGLGSAGYIGSAVEKAKYFNFPTNTQEYRITFPLLNTVRANDWKKNYRFIILFMLRNLIFRKDSASYYPPLFYDLVIPGVIRQPFCYVGKFQVRPVGNVRTLGYDHTLINGLNVAENANTNFSVNVPEAWIVTITFNSLLTTSANMVLSGLYDLNITTK